MSLELGTRLDAYEILRLLGAGGMGEVYLARELRLEREVALKLFPHELTKDTHRVARFEQEARAASALSHPNICTIFALGEAADGRQFIAMEYVDGHTLRQRLSTGRVTVRETVDFAVQIVSGVAAAHSRLIVHRDLKPDNVIVRQDGLVKIVDFGLAKLLVSSAGSSASTTAMAHTHAGSVVGTVSYMSPEQARGQEVDGRTDVWSVGVMLYEMVAGQVPFEQR